MEEKIFDEIRRLKLAKNHVWRFQQYNSFRYDALNPKEQRDFDSFMEKYCQDGIFTAENDGSVIMYRLTEKGEEVIYS